VNAQRRSIEWDTAARLLRLSDRIEVQAMRIIHTDAAPGHTGPVPQAVEAGGWVYVSATFGVDPHTGALPADAAEEADRLLRNLTAVLAAAGAALTDVVRVGVFMRDLQGDRPAFNEIWRRHFGEHRPARAAVEVADFGRQGQHPRYMIEATALLPPGATGG
jgi:2-iminobutanoate/2-iminopropanoate deaminase